MKFNDDFKHPRLYVESDLKTDTPVELNTQHIHYLKNVMRKNDNDPVRLFNGRDGEWLSHLSFSGKKSGQATPFKHFKPQGNKTPPTHLLFAPIKKKPMDFLIEKAVELGVSDLHPVITARTENRHINIEKMKLSILEAAEQCERLDVPTLHPPEKLNVKIAQWPKDHVIYWAAERMENTPTLKQTQNADTFLIGPEGGFDDAETKFLSTTGFISPIDLGDQILRAETAALFCLSHAKLSQEK
jgi:16S rRNA (uracil1498-N3)-methyltransferase